MTDRAIGPLLITQHNCMGAVGIEQRRFLSLVRELRLRVIRIGKVRAVRADELLSALEARAENEPEPATQEAEPAPKESQLDRLMRAAGLSD